MNYRQTFTHHGQSFVIEADDWPNEEAAGAAIIDLQMWAITLDPDQTADLHHALSHETAALIDETPYERDQLSLCAARDAQRRAIRIGRQVSKAEGYEPTVSIEAG